MYNHVRAALRVKGLTNLEKLVLTILADMADENGNCWPARDYISEALETVDTSVSRATRRLEEHKLIHKKQRWNQPPMYTVLIGVSDTQDTVYSDTQDTVGGDDEDTVRDQYEAPLEAPSYSASAESTEGSGTQELEEGVTSLPESSGQPTPSPGSEAAPSPPGPKKRRRRILNEDEKGEKARLLRVYEDELGYTPQPYPREAKAADMLIREGFAADDIMYAYRRMKPQPFWQGKHLSLMSVRSQLGAILAERRKEEPTEPVVPVSEQEMKEIVDWAKKIDF